MIVSSQTNAIYCLDRRGQQRSNQTVGGFAKESEEAGKPPAEMQRGDAHTQGAKSSTGDWERNTTRAAAGEAAGAGEDKGA